MSTEYRPGDCVIITLDTLNTGHVGDTGVVVGVDKEDALPYRVLLDVYRASGALCFGEEELVLASARVGAILERE